MTVVLIMLQATLCNTHTLQTGGMSPSCRNVRLVESIKKTVKGLNPGVTVVLYRTVVDSD